MSKVTLVQNQLAEIRITIDSETVFRYMCTRCEYRLGDRLAMGLRRCSICCQVQGMDATEAEVPSWVKKAFNTLTEYGG